MPEYNDVLCAPATIPPNFIPHFLDVRVLGT